jgi:hypothetical protein
MGYKYRVYLKTFDMSETIGVKCNNMEEVEIVLDQAEEKYFFYMIIRHDIKLNMDEVIERGQIKHEINKRLVKTPKLN